MTDFVLDQVVLEVRYSVAYLLWDRAGRIGAAIYAAFGDVELQDAAPGRIMFRIEKSVDVVVELERARVVSIRPSGGMEFFADVCSKALKIVLDILEVSELLRVGFRPQLVREFETAEKADAAFFALDLLRVPPTAVFGVKSTEPKTPSYAVRFEDDEIGASIRISLALRQVETEQNPLFNVPEYSETHHLLIFDVDYYTRTTLRVADFHGKLLVESMYAKVRRSMKEFVE